MDMYYTIYKVTNIINGKFYIGKHQTNNPHDSYMGSGVAIKAAIKKYGKKSFKKEVLFIFDNEDDMNLKEIEIVEINENSYNLTEGGKGGFGYINRNGYNRGELNAMKNPDIVKKNIESRKITRQARKEHYDAISIQNLSKTWESNKGKKRPEHSLLMKQRGELKQRWIDKKEQIRDEISGTYKLIDPDNHEYITNRLGEFCIQKNFSFTTIWAASKRGTIITKGKSKGWTCIILAQ